MTADATRLLQRAALAGLVFRRTGAEWAIDAPLGDKADALLAELKADREPVVAALRERQALGDRIEKAIDRSGRMPPPAWLVEVDEAHREFDLDRLEVLARRFKRWAEGKLDPTVPLLVVLSAAGKLGGEPVVVVLDEAVRVPAHLERMPIYTWDEVRRLDGAPLPVLQAVHLTKGTWPAARVVARGSEKGKL